MLRPVLRRGGVHFHSAYRVDRGYGLAFTVSGAAPLVRWPMAVMVMMCGHEALRSEHYIYPLGAYHNYPLGV
jgi:hypothetical protein